MHPLEYRPKHPIKKEGLAWFFFGITLVSLAWIALHEFGGRVDEPSRVTITEAQLETQKRAKIIQKVLEEGKLQLTSSKHYRVLEDKEE